MVPARWCLSILALSVPLLATAADPPAPASADWSVHGHDDAGTRFSPLAQINAGNVKDLGLAWTYSLDSTRGVESTPLVVDGVMYVTAPWSVVHAIDARTGKGLWVYDPQVPRTGGYKACCDVVNRGVAFHDGKVYVASLDGRLAAIDAASGKKVWEQDTIIDHSHNYMVTGRAAHREGQGPHRQQRRGDGRARLRGRLRRGHR